MISRKQRIADLLRRMHLLQLADWVMLAAEVQRNRASNRDFLSAHPDFVPPPAHLAFDAYNHTNWQAYHDAGRQHARMIADLCRAYLRRDVLRLCEWGCGPARVIRHLDAIDGFDAVERSASDYNRQSIAWCRASIPGVTFADNGLEPPLPFAADSFDCIYAISIFTHLSGQMHHAWFDELMRVVAPGGIVIFTTHGDRCAVRLDRDERARYDAGELVVKGQIKEGRKLFAAYQPPRFVEQDLVKQGDILLHMPDASAYDFHQDVWVVRKR